MTKYEDTGYIFSESGKPIKEINFDVCVVVSEKVGKKGIIGITISKIGLGGERNNEQVNGKDSRIQFTVPITLPSMNK